MLREAQFKRIQSYLAYTSVNTPNNPSSSKSSSRSIFPEWRILLHDQRGKEILSPLFNLGQLKKMGITVNLDLDNTETEPLPSVPAVYFISPTTTNLEYIIRNISRHLYSSSYLNFTTLTPNSIIQDLASSLHSTNDIDRLVGFHDLYVNFISLQPSLFTLKLPKAYSVLSSSDETVAMEHLDKIVDGLFSVFATLQTIPVLYVQKNGPAYQVALRLRQLFSKSSPNSRWNVFSKVSRSSQSSRPCLILYDRDIDLASPLAHSWKYEALLFDLCHLSNNRAVVRLPGKKSTDPNLKVLTRNGKKKTFDLDIEQDDFYSCNFASPFPNVTENLRKEIQSYSEETIHSSDSSDISKLAQAINNMNKLTDRKTFLDMHTDLCSFLLDELTDRGINHYFHLEASLFHHNSLSSSQNQELLSLLLPSKSESSDSDSTLKSSDSTPKSGELATKSYYDTLRLLLIHSLLATTPLDPTVVQQYKTTLPPKFASMYDSIISKISRIKKFSSKTIPPSSSTASLTSTLFNAAKSVKRLVSDDVSDICPKITTLTSSFLSNPQSPSNSFTLIDPLGDKSGSSNISSFTTLVVYVVGGGCMNEYLSLTEVAKNSGKNIIYGSCKLFNPISFLHEIE